MHDFTYQGVLVSKLTIYGVGINFDESESHLLGLKVDFIKNMCSVTVHPDPLPLAELFNFVCCNIF